MEEETHTLRGKLLVATEYGSALPNDWSHRLSVDDLIALWRCLWNGTAKSFAETYGVNAGNFSRFLNKKKTANHAIRAIQAYLRGAPVAPMASGPRIMSWAAIADDLRSHTSLRHLYLVDGDNVIGVLDQFYEALPAAVWRGEARADHHCIVGMVRANTDHVTGPYAWHNWVSFNLTSTNCKNATDMLLTARAVQLHYLLPADVTFYLVSNDGFVRETAALLREIGRRVQLWDPKPAPARRKFVRETE